jgi:glycosyltransferase involved in cell wall biosynthesis
MRGWKVIPIELRDGAPELRRAPGYRGIYAIFFVNGRALGHRPVSNEELPLSACQVANVAAPAIAIGAGDCLLPDGFRSALPYLPEPGLMQPERCLSELLALEQPIERLRAQSSDAGVAPQHSVSVAICTRERPEELTRCLESLLDSCEAPQEIVVVDNAPLSTATRDVVARFAGVRYCLEQRRGLSAARNTAMSITTGDIIAFVDDDVAVDRHWVSRIRRSFSDPKLLVVTGLVLPGELETEAQVLFEQDCQFFHQGYRARDFDANFFERLRGKGVPVWSIGAGANMAIHRAAFELGYRFDRRLGPGVFGGCGEDSEFWYHVLADGWSCRYEPSMIAYHYHRKDLRALRRLVRSYMQGHVAALLLQTARYRHMGNLRRLLLTLPREYLLLLLRLVVTAFPLHNRILFSGALGCISGLRFPFAASTWRDQSFDACRKS